MINRFALAALALTCACLPAQAVVVTYTYNSRPMFLPFVPEGYSVYGNNIGSPGPTGFSFVVSVELDALGGTMANTHISQSLDSNRELVTTASRNGVILAEQNSQGGGWFSGGFFVDTYSFFAFMDFDAKANVGAWHFSTDSENQFALFGGNFGDSYGWTGFSDWQPYPPVWSSDGPGTWTRTPALPSPVPLPAGVYLLATGIIGMIAAGKTKRRIRTF